MENKKTILQKMKGAVNVVTGVVALGTFAIGCDGSGNPGGTPGDGKIGCRVTAEREFRNGANSCIQKYGSGSNALANVRMCTLGEAMQTAVEHEYIGCIGISPRKVPTTLNPNDWGVRVEVGQTHGDGRLGASDVYDLDKSTCRYDMSK